MKRSHLGGHVALYGGTGSYRAEADMGVSKLKLRALMTAWGPVEISLSRTILDWINALATCDHLLRTGDSLCSVAHCNPAADDTVLRNRTREGCYPDVNGIAS